MRINKDNINQLLPQTQCKECGYQGCEPYAEALATGEAAINLCLPGGEVVMQDISLLLQTNPIPVKKQYQQKIAWIDESTCIGCTACIKACPVDAIMGASKLMHTVIDSECTGCGLCIEPCPVDCIHFHQSTAKYLPKNNFLSSNPIKRFAASEHAKKRYKWHLERKKRDDEERKKYLTEREALALKQKKVAQTTATFNPLDLIAQAMQRAQSSQTQRSKIINQEEFQNQQLIEFQSRARFRKAQNQLKYGNEAEKKAAIEWLRQYKADNEANQPLKNKNSH